jgi:DNA-binding NtrC family response regulator
LAADSIAAGHKSAVENRVEAIISDLKLPDGSGLDMAIDLGLPFILMSGYGNFEDAVGALRHGCVDFLTKPVALDALKAGVHRLANPGSKAPSVISTQDDCVVVYAEATSLAQQSVTARDYAWESQAEAQALFHNELVSSLEPLRMRQLVAELMQITGSQRLVLNLDKTGMRCWLPMQTDWSAAEHQDRRALIELLADHCWWRPEGCIVEYCHEH